VNKFYDFLDVGLLMLLTVSGLVAFIKLTTIGDVALGTCGIVAFILFGLAIFRRSNEED
jgi:glycopeptide antibiotics resistance protein